MHLTVYMYVCLHGQPKNSDTHNNDNGIMSQKMEIMMMGQFCIDRAMLVGNVEASGLTFLLCKS